MFEEQERMHQQALNLHRKHVEQFESEAERARERLRELQNERDWLAKKNEKLVAKPRRREQGGGSL